jgi:hypothetical protein
MKASPVQREIILTTAGAAARTYEEIKAALRHEGSDRALRQQIQRALDRGMIDVSFHPEPRYRATPNGLYAAKNPSKLKVNLPGKTDAATASRDTSRLGSLP